MTIEEARAQFPNVEIPDDAKEIRFYVKKGTERRNDAEYLTESSILEYYSNGSLVKVLTKPIRSVRRRSL